MDGSRRISEEPVLTHAGDACGPGMATTEVAHGGIALNPDHTGGLLPQFTGNGAERVLQLVMALDIPPCRTLTMITPKALNPFTGKRQDTIEGGQKFV